MKLSSTESPVTKNPNDSRSWMLRISDEIEARAASVKIWQLGDKVDAYHSVPHLPVAHSNWAILPSRTLSRQNSTNSSNGRPTSAESIS